MALIFAPLCINPFSKSKRCLSISTLPAFLCLKRKIVKNMHTFRQFIQNYTLLSNADWASVEKHLVRMEIKKETILLQEGKICRHLYFLESGLL
jgi:hypothetical protein